MMFEPHAKNTISATFDYTSSKGTPALLGFIGGEQAYYWNQQPVCFTLWLGGMLRQPILGRRGSKFSLLMLFYRNEVRIRILNSSNFSLKFLKIEKFEWWFVKKTRARITRIILFDDTFWPKSGFYLNKIDNFN